MCVKSQFSSLIPTLEGINHKLCSSENLVHLDADVAPHNGREFFDGYFHRNRRYQIDFTGYFGIDSLDHKTHKYRFTFEKIAVESLDIDDLSWRSDSELPLHISRCGHNNMQTPMPIFSGTVMESQKSFVEVGICRVRRFSSVVRLDRLDPIPQYLREWQSVDSVGIEFTDRSTNRKLDTILIGGWIDSFSECGCGVYRSVQCGTKLIEELSQLQSQVVIGNCRWRSLDDATPPIAIYFNGRSEGFWMQQGFPLFLKSFSMPYGPTDATTTVSK